MQRLSGNGNSGSQAILASEHSFCAGNHCHGRAVLTENCQTVGDDIIINQRTVAVVDHNNGVLGAFLFQLLQTVTDGFLTGFATFHNPFQLGDVKLVGISLHEAKPAGKGYQDNGVNLGVVLETLQGIDNNGLVLYMKKLLGDILTHTGTLSGSGKQCYCHTFSPLMTFSIASTIRLEARPSSIQPLSSRNASHSCSKCSSLKFRMLSISWALSTAKG